MATYAEKLKDPRWQKKRLEILNRDDWRCQQCFDGDNTLHVHHRRYITGRDPWDYPDHMLVTMCETCHAAEKESMEEAIGALIEQCKDELFGSEVMDLAKCVHTLGMRAVVDLVLIASGDYTTIRIADHPLIKAHREELAAGGR